MQPQKQAPRQASTQAEEADIAWLSSQLDRPVTREELGMAKSQMSEEYAKLEALARQQAELNRVPPPPAGAAMYGRSPGTVDRIANNIDWNGIAQSGMGLLAEIVKERRAARAGPSLAEQIGQLAISNFAATLSKERGRMMGKQIPEDEEEQYVKNPVTQVMLAEMTKKISNESKAREDMAAKWDLMAKELEAARAKIASQPQQQYQAPPQKEEPQVVETEAKVESAKEQAHEEPAVPDDGGEGAQT
jgi:hypothetical protein